MGKDTSEVRRDAPHGESFAQRVAELERVIQTNHPTINNEIILDLLQCVRAQQAALRNAVPEAIEDTCIECNGGPCAGCWVLSARATLARWRIEP